MSLLMVLFHRQRPYIWCSFSVSHCPYSWHFTVSNCYHLVSKTGMTATTFQIGVVTCILCLKLKLIDLLHATCWTPPWLLTDNFNGLVMVILNYHWLNSASRVLISTCSAPLVQTGERKQIHSVWPWPLTYDLDLQFQASQGQCRPSCEKSRSKVKRFKQESAHRQTDGHTHTHLHGRYQTYYLPCYAVDKNDTDVAH